MNEFEDEMLTAMMQSWDNVLAQTGSAARPGMNAPITPASACISALETRQAYLDLVASQACAPAPCLTDSCPQCLPLLALIDTRGTDCDARGCTPAHCVYDKP